MSVEELEKAIAALPPEKLEKFSAWFEEFEAARMDRKIEQSIQRGDLDKFGDQAIGDFRKGAIREL